MKKNKCGAGAPSTSSGQALARQKADSRKIGSVVSVFRSGGWVLWVCPPIPAKLL